MSCAIEDDEACGANQVYTTGRGLLDYAVCLCDEVGGYVFDNQHGYGCKRCADGESALGGKCVGEMADAGAVQPDSSTAPAPAPTGVGESCGTTDDCAGYDATYCAMGVCLVEKCATGENACGVGPTCCDFSALLSGFSLCLPAEYLESGACPMGGMRVEQ